MSTRLIIPLKDRVRLLVNPFGVFFQARRHHEIKRRTYGSGASIWQTRGSYASTDEALRCPKVRQALLASTLGHRL